MLIKDYFLSGKIALEKTYYKRYYLSVLMRKANACRRRSRR